MIEDEDNEYSTASSKDGIADKILNGSKSIFDKVLSPSKEKLSFPKVCFNHKCHLKKILILNYH